MFKPNEIKFYDDLTKEEKDLLKNGTFEKKFLKSELIHNSVEPCRGVIIVREGRLRTYLLSDEGKEITLYYLEKGDICILSASCVLSTISFEVHIEADKDTEVLQISASCFNQIMKSNLKVENFALRLATEKFSDVMWAMQQILFFSMDKRLSMYLYEEAIKTSDNVLQVTHEQIAKSLGTAREVVTRLLKQFVLDNVVKLTRGQITIVDRNKLMSIFS